MKLFGVAFFRKHTFVVLCHSDNQQYLQRGFSPARHDLPPIYATVYVH